MTIQNNQEPRWKQLFRTPSLLRTEIAPLNPERGIAITDKNGPLQVNRWDVKTGELTQANDLEHGSMTGWISPDGEWIYYMNDPDGSEVGHLVRVPYDGGEVQDLTPDMEPYGVFELYSNEPCIELNFIAAEKSGFNLYKVELQNNLPATPVKLLSDERDMF